MHLDGLDSLPIGSVADRVRTAAFYRRAQQQIYATLTNVYASVVATKPDILKEVQKTVEAYMELLIPGSRAMHNKAQDNFVKRQAKDMESIYAALTKHNAQFKDKPMDVGKI
jgi:replicative DNA helicase